MSISNRTYHILLRIDESKFTPDGANGCELAEVVRDADDAAAEIASWGQFNRGTDGLWLRWSACAGVHAGGSTRGVWAELHRLIMKREMPKAFEATVLEGISLAIRMDAREFGEVVPSSVKGSPK